MHELQKVDRVESKIVDDIFSMIAFVSSSLWFGSIVISVYPLKRPAGDPTKT